MHERNEKYTKKVGKSEAKRPLGRDGCRWKEDIRMDLQKTGWEGVDCIRLV